MIDPNERRPSRREFLSTSTAAAAALTFGLTCSTTGTTLNSSDKERLRSTLTPALFARVASGGRWKMAPHLAVLDRWAVQAAMGRQTGIITEIPPRHGKSEFYGKYLPAWYLGTFPNHRVGYVSYEARQARKFGRSARNIFNQCGKEIFGREVSSDSSAANEWNIAGFEGGMETTGIGGPLTGKGFHLLVIDDPIKNAEDAASEVIREKAWDWFQSTAMTRLEPGGAVIVNMTRWHKDDLVGRILESDDADEWQRIRFPAIAEGSDELGRKAGDALWPARYPLQTTVLPSGRRLRGLEAIRDSMPLYWWMALYQQQPTQHASVEWPDDYFDWPGFRFDRWPSDIVLKAVSLDPSKGKTKHSDYSAFILLGQDTKGDIWCDADLQRRPATVIAEDGASLMRAFRPHGFICEANAWQDLLSIPFAPYFNTPELSGVEVCWFNNVVAKEIRIRRLDPLLRSRKFHVRNSKGGDLLVSQLRQFPMAEHDDGPDSLEMGTQMLAYLKTGTPIDSRGIEQNLVWSSNMKVPT